MHNVHVHVWDQSLHFSEQNIRESALSRGHPIDLSVRFEELMADLAPFERALVFGLKARRTGWWVPDEYVAEFVRRAPNKLSGLAASDPTDAKCLDELRHALDDLGLSGVKLGPAYAGFDPRDPRCEPIYELCEKRGLPILFHTGTTFNSQAILGFSRPWLWDEVAMRHPELRMVLAHVGHPFCEECLVVIRKHPHVYADISALYYRPWQFYNMLIAAQEYRVTHKLLFGSDYPFATGQESIDGLRNANRIAGSSGLPEVTAETIDGILHRDAFGLLGLAPPRDTGAG